MAEFNIKDLFKSTKEKKAPTSYYIEQAIVRKEISSLGQQYYATDLVGREFFLPVWINDFLIPFAVIGMNWKKTIISTPMPERGGSAHEGISIDDYVFTIKGLLVNEDGEFPEEDVIAIHDLFKINASVRLRSAVSAIVLNGNYDEKVIIREVEWPMVTGIENVKSFEIKVESDMMFDLTLD
jgi:hypothetical protein